MPWLLVVAAAVARLFPHPWNVTPLGGVSLFAGAHTRLGWALLTPAIGLFIGDAIRGFYNGTVMVGVYLGLLIAPLFGRLLRRQRSATRFAAAIGGSSLSFFLISNLFVWLAGFYPKTIEGLISCYAMGLPYLGRTLLANTLYTALFFGAFHLATQHAHRFTAPERH